MEATHFESLYPDDTRENEIAKILSFIKEGSSCQIIGLPGGGRSNLLGLLSYNRSVREKHLGENQKWLHFVLLNFSEIRKRPIADAAKFLFLGLIESLGERRMQEEYQTINKIFKESIDIHDELVLFQGLKRAIDFLAIEKELTIVFLFDNFDEYVPMLSPEFFVNLRVLRNRAKYRFSVVFSLHKPLEDLIGQDLLLDFYQFVAGHTVYLSIFDKIGLDFRISYIEKASGKTLDKKLIDVIINLTAGQPNLTRLSVEAVIDTENVILEARRADRIPKADPIATLQDDNTMKFLLEQKPIKAALFEIWKSLTPAEQKLLTNVILSKAKNLDPSVASLSQDDNQNSYLQNVGLIKDKKITIPLFEQFVKEIAKESPTQAKQRIAFNPATNEVKKGDIMLSDSLTSSEFKLLTYLMQNNGKIIEREEVINAVWKDNKTNAGVTDQALDQLIFRLRKKIEDDPNNPTHLQTVKGRGFRFIP